MTYAIPADAHEEIARLAGDGLHPTVAWRQGRTDTTFRRQIMPHADRDDPAFRIVVPMSGGLDSATCYQMATLAGLPVEAVMVDTGVPYARYDQQAAALLTGGALTVLDLPEGGEWVSVGDFQSGRNSVIVWHLLEWARAHGWWGQLWLGNLGGNYLETPIVGGDKSFRWAATLQHMATATGHDMHLSSPLGGMSKADLVTWWEGRHMIDVALATRSCFADLPGQCGRCWACLYRYVAFAARGYGPEVLATYRHGVDFAEPAREFWRRASWGLVTTSPLRMQEAITVMENLGLGRAWAQDAARGR